MARAFRGRAGIPDEATVGDQIDEGIGVVTVDGIMEKAHHLDGRGRRRAARQRGRPLSLDPPGGVIVDDHLTMIGLARPGLGLAHTADLVAASTLESLLAPYMPSQAGLFLYFPARSQHQPKLRAFIDVATRVLRAS